MSFVFEWPRFSDEFHKDAIQLLEGALNKGNKPPVIADRIEVVELEMGTQPPELEIRDIGDLTMNQFRGIFRLTYSGDAYIVLRTKVQANPLYHKKRDIHLMGGSRGMLAANQPLVVPMLLRLSNFKLNAYVVLVVSKPKGITLVFKTDPLQNVDISSTFDSIAVIQKFIQQEIEGQLRQMFREDLPGIIHRLSQRWVRSTTAMGVTNVPKAHVEAPYLKQRISSSSSTLHAQPRKTYETMSNPDISRFAPASSWQTPPFQPHLRPGLNPRSVSLSGRSVGSKPSYSDLRASTGRSETAYAGHESLDEIDDRPDFRALGRVYRPSRGLADLVEEESINDTVSDFSVDATEVGSFDVVEWEDTVPDMSVIAEEEEPSPHTPVVTEYETIPAVGGGYISRPRVLHSTSFHHASNSPSSTSSSSPRIRNSGLSTSSSVAGGRFGESQRPGMPTRVQSYDAHEFYATRTRQYANSIAAHTQRQQQQAFDASPSSPPSPHTEPLPLRRRPSVSRSQLASSPFLAPQPDSSLDPSAENLDLTSNPQIVLRPGLNNTVTQLSLLNHANHTLSPYARVLEHFTIRSAPPRERGGNTVLGASVGLGQSPGQDRLPVKARRKRTYRLGGKNPTIQEPNNQSALNEPERAFSPASLISPPSTPPQSSSRLAPPPPPISPSEFDEAEFDRYFRPSDPNGQPQPGMQRTASQAYREKSPAPAIPSQSQSHFRRRASHRSLRT